MTEKPQPGAPALEKGLDLLEALAGAPGCGFSGFIHQACWVHCREHMLAVRFRVPDRPSPSGNSESECSRRSFGSNR
jgi:hypothetical protein